MDAGEMHFRLSTSTYVVYLNIYRHTKTYPVTFTPTYSTTICTFRCSPFRLSINHTICERLIVSRHNFIYSLSALLSVTIPLWFSAKPHHSFDLHIKKNFSTIFFRSYSIFNYVVNKSLNNN